MFLRRIEIDRFLSFGLPAELNLGPGLTVVTGPNAAGKSNIGRCLDVARAVLAAHDDPEAERLDLYQGAGYEDAPEFTIKLDMDLDQAWEQDLVRTYVRASYVASKANLGSLMMESFEEAVDWLVGDSLAPLMSGLLVIRYRGAVALGHGPQPGSSPTTRQDRPGTLFWSATTAYSNSGRDRQNTRPRQAAPRSSRTG